MGIRIQGPDPGPDRVSPGAKTPKSGQQENYPRVDAYRPPVPALDGRPARVRIRFRSPAGIVTREAVAVSHWRQTEAGAPRGAARQLR
jgi:hypothetical protein